MKKITDKDLENWQESEYICGDLFNHFRNFGRWDWCEIAEEGRRVFGLMFREDVEDDSAADGLISAVAAQANRGAFSFIASALGVETKELMLAIAEIIEDQDKPPKKIPPTELIKMCEEKGKWIKSLRRKTRKRRRGS